MAAVCFIAGACHHSQNKISPAAAKQARLEWNLKTLVGVYQDIGSTDDKWDVFATNALAEFARSRAAAFSPDEDFAGIIRTNCRAALAAGCDDPLVHYIYIKYAMEQTNSKEAFTAAFCKTADELQQGHYPKLRQFYASLRAAEQMKYAAGTNWPPEIHHYRRQAMTDLAEALVEKTMPIGEADEACQQMLEALTQNQKQYEDCYGSIENTLFKNWPDESAVWLLKGEAYYKKAWFARGGGYADKVTDEGWKNFNENLAVAETAAKKAWKLNPTDARIPGLMIRLDEGLQRERPDMELWFQRAMQINPNNYEACKYKLHFLYPQWYGSRDEMIAFGRECVASNNWGGSVPLILLDAHWEFCSHLQDSEEKNNYWKQPGVWPDIMASFERFFELNPEATGWYHNYAWYAYHAEQWDKLNELIPKLGVVNYAYFGGEAEFNKMVQLAKEHARNSKTEAGK